MGILDDPIDTITGTAGDFKDKATDKLKDLKGDATDTLDDVRDFTLGKATDARDFVGGKLSGLADRVLDRLQELPPELKKFLEVMQGVDTDRIRAAGKLWGDGTSTSGGSGKLEAWATDLDKAFESQVADVWAGDSKEAFEEVLLPAIIAELDGGGKTESEKQRFAVVGKALVDLADEWEISGLDVLEKLLTFLGIAVTILFWETGWGAVIGIIITALGVLVSLLQDVLPRLEVIAQGESSLKGTWDGKSLSSRLPAFPSNRNGWQFNP